MKNNIPFNKPYLSGKEMEYIQDAVNKGHISGNGYYTKKCQSFMEERYGFRKCLLTTSCTDALEMSAILLNISEGDEVIMPSYTFVSTANAFVLRGAKIVYVDSNINHPNMDVESIESLITPKTKAIVVVHYAGIACEMNHIMNLANKHSLFVVEDAAQAIDSYYEGRPLGSIGHLAAFSFHETKNIQCGEGGMLVVNDQQFAERAEIIWEKGTNRSAFYRGEVSKYEWKDIGSSFLPSELNAAYLYAQLENLDQIQEKRKSIWKQYYEGLSEVKSRDFTIAQNIGNAHIFHVLLNNERNKISLKTFFQERSILTLKHYVPLHSSEYGQTMKTVTLPNSDIFGKRLLRLPIFPELTDYQVTKIISVLKQYFEN